MYLLIPVIYYYFFGGSTALGDKIDILESDAAREFRAREILNAPSDPENPKLEDLEGSTKTKKTYQKYYVIKYVIFFNYFCTFLFVLCIF